MPISLTLTPDATDEDDRENDDPIERRSPLRLRGVGEREEEERSLRERPLEREGERRPLEREGDLRRLRCSATRVRSLSESVT